ncbi:MAG: hypothetical protein CVU44_21100 [Chloroflexi bacterium HGW-Chloroflexi-6]|nr:MAG: hypothetical protein CVU44_21100 [Chloroflexi bacterium HGW-Chloroflexi-6]
MNYSVPSDDKTFIPFHTENRIVLISPEKPSVTLDLPAGNYDLNSLLNGQILAAPFASIFKAPADNEIYQKGVGYTDTYYIYDRETGEQIESHSVFLPKFTFDYAGGVWGADISYSPDGNFVLYRSTLIDGKNAYSLLDLRSSQIKWTLPESDKVLGTGDEKPYMPTWKPDANSLTYIGTSNNNKKSQNFYNISLDGTITQFTRFEDVFQPGYILNFHPQWSSDKRYMAFKIQKPDRLSIPELFIWDDVDKILLNPCLPVSGIEPPGAYEFDWSFDSEHIVLTLSYPPHTTSTSGTADYDWRTLILDISTKTIYKLPDGKSMNNYLHLSGDVFYYGIVDWMDWEIP